MAYWTPSEVDKSTNKLRGDLRGGSLTKPENLIKITNAFAALLSLGISMTVSHAESREVFGSRTYDFLIENRCKEGSVTCDNIVLEARNKNTGELLKAVGSTHHIRCTDGITPCRFIGYIFKQKDLEIFIDNQYIQVTRKGEARLRERFN